MTTSVSLDRTSLSLSALLISTTLTDTYWLPETGVEWPKFGRRKSLGDPSPYLSGRPLLARVSDMGSLPLTVYVRATTSSALDTAKTALQTAVDQWTYDLTLTVDGVAATYTAECADDEIAWGEIDSGMVGAHIARGSLVIPLYP